MRAKEFILEGKYGGAPYTFNQPRRQLNVPLLIQRGAIFITEPHGDDGWEPDSEGFSLITLWNVMKGGWPAEAKQHLRPNLYDAASKGLNTMGLSDQKYNQILWSIKKLGIPEEQAFLDAVKENKTSITNLAEVLKEIALGSWHLYENRGPVEFRKSSIFDQTVANKSRQAPNLLAKVSSFIDSKTINPTQPWGSRDKPFGAKGPIGMSMPKLHYAHLNNDLVLFYEIEGRDPTVIKLYGVFSHDDIGIGQPGNIRKQKSLIQQLSHQRI